MKTSLCPFAGAVLAVNCLLWPCNVNVAGEPIELMGHGDAVYDVSFSPDGSILASGSYDRTVKLWDVETNQVLATLEGHQDQVYRVSFAPDGKTLASSSADGSAIIWDLTTFKPRMFLRGHASPVLDVAYSSDGALLATVGYDSRLRLVDSVDGHEVWSIKLEQPLFSVAFSTTDDTLAVGTEAEVNLLTTCCGKDVGSLVTNSGVTYQIDYSPDHNWLASAGSNGTLTVWDIRNQKQRGAIRADQSALFTARFSPDGKLLATAGRERVIRVWSSPDLTKVSEYLGPQETVLSVAFSPDGKRLVSGAYDGRIHMWSLDIP